MFVFDSDVSSCSIDLVVVLARYLDMQFEKQSALIGMVLAQGRGTSTSLQSPPSSPSPAPNPSSPLNFKLREQLSGVSSGQMGSEDGNRLHLQLPQTQTRELEDQLHMKQGELMRSSSVLGSTMTHFGICSDDCHNAHMSDGMCSSLASSCFC